MINARVVFANQPLAYREAIATVIQAVRPAIEVTVSAPEDLDAEIARVQPHLVVCNALPNSMRSRLLAWVVLYPDGQNLVTCSIAGQERSFPGVDLSGLLTLIDEVVNQLVSVPHRDPLSIQPDGAHGR